jgi:hypothetical protein
MITTYHDALAIAFWADFCTKLRTWPFNVNDVYYSQHNMSALRAPGCMVVVAVSLPDWPPLTTSRVRVPSCVL